MVEFISVECEGYGGTAWPVCVSRDLERRPPRPRAQVGIGFLLAGKRKGGGMEGERKSKGERGTFAEHVLRAGRARRHRAASRFRVY